MPRRVPPPKETFVECTPTLPPCTFTCCERDGELLLMVSAKSTKEVTMTAATVFLDNRLVAKARTGTVLQFTRALTDLDPGRHRVRFIVHYDTGDMRLEHRVFNYTGPTLREERERAVHLLCDKATGVVSSGGKHELWRLDASIPLPCNVVLHCAAKSPIYIQLCRSSSTQQQHAFEPPVLNQDGKAVLVIRDEPYFVVGTSAQWDQTYDLTVEREAPATAAALSLWTGNSPRVPRAYAVAVGVSVYRYISHLSFCDEDCVSWCDFLTRGQYVVHVLGDGVSSYAPFVPQAVATEENIRRHIQAVLEVIQEGDLFVFATSGHGSGDGKGHSWLCCVDEHNVPDGEYDDSELAEDLSAIVARGAKTFAFVDHCFSGGLIDDMQRKCPDSENWFMATTCSEAGYGFDDSSTHHGAWTYSFLIQGLETRYKDANPPLGDVFDYARSVYRFRKEKKNEPQCAGNRNLRIL
jgi:hypothetical protein